MGLFNQLLNFDPDSFVKKIDDFEQLLDKVVDNVDSAAKKVDNTSKIIEEKLTPPSAKTAEQPEENKQTDGTD